jgi:hypothetical protein
MRLPLYLLAFAAVFATAALGEDDCRCWTPDAEQIAAVEATLASRPLPLGSLDRYVRYYAGTFSYFNRRFIRGKLAAARMYQAFMSWKAACLRSRGTVASSFPCQVREHR